MCNSLRPTSARQQIENRFLLGYLGGCAAVCGLLSIVFAHMWSWDILGVLGKLLGIVGLIAGALSLFKPSSFDDES
jgi:hypothetical protein